jgi:hypothetical protein
MSTRAPRLTGSSGRRTASSATTRTGGDTPSGVGTVGMPRSDGSVVLPYSSSIRPIIPRSRLTSSTSSSTTRSISV